MAWKRSPPELIAAFEKAKPDDPGVQSRPMFGYPSVFWNGNHFAGTFQDKIVARLSEATLAVMHHPDVIKLLEDQQVTPMATGPAQFEQLIKNDLQRWETVIKTAGIKGE